MGKKRMFDLERLTQQTINRLSKNPKCSFSLFGLERVEYITKPLGFNYIVIHERSKELETQFHEYLSDDDFAKKEYCDIVGGVVNDTENYIEWAREIGAVISRYDPENLIFYLRNEHPTIRSRILIPAIDFYRGLTNEQIIAKYGTETFEKMSEHLADITISVDSDGKMRTPKRDIEYALRLVKGEQTNPEMWD
ncbi:MAG: hypothetical protein ACOCUT_00980 [bacterium]